MTFVSAARRLGDSTGYHPKWRRPWSSSSRRRCSSTRSASKSLRGELAGFRVARRGDYRVLLRIHESPNIVEVVRIAHRADAYRGLQSADPPKNESL